MVQRGESLGFSREPSSTLGIIGQLRRQDFKRNLPIERGVLRKIDVTHSTGADLLQNRVVSECRANHLTRLSSLPHGWRGVNPRSAAQFTTTSGLPHGRGRVEDIVACVIASDANTIDGGVPSATGGRCAPVAGPGSVITVDSSVRLEVLEWGGSGRPLVLLGCYLTAHMHDEFAPKLTNEFHLYDVLEVLPVAAPARRQS